MEYTSHGVFTLSSSLYQCCGASANIIPLVDMEVEA